MLVASLLAVLLPACRTTNQAAGPMVTEVYAVRDLVDAAAGPARAGEIPGDRWSEALADLSTCVREATDSTYWQREGARLCAEDSGHLVVTASVAMQARVDKVLADMRQLAAPPAGR